MADTDNTGPLRIGILSTANIGRHFIAGVKPSDKVKVVAVASRDLASAQAFADRHAIPRALGSYDALLADPEVEAIYNPLPNSMHAEWTIRALEAGKHVLCEKPIAVTAADARAMFAAAHSAGRCLVEAFPYRAQPQTHAVAELVHSGEIGLPKIIQAAFGFPVANPSNIRLDPGLGGGALLDAGTYPVSLIRLLAGVKPIRVSAMATWTESGVDATLIANIEFPGGLLAQAACSFGTGVYRRATIACEGGVVMTEYLNHLTAAAPGVVDISRGGWDATNETRRFEPLDGFRAEADSFADLVRGDPAGWTGIGEAESIEVMEMLEAIIASAAAHGAPVEL
ncbi:Gfo/Idh/MocA family protein [Glacieibacterium megasporae]|uniref:Gfo/Idh/MocA family protein n=1 Tax=Glacieibacterium megasporae TaxID=2835787 RepID=UPI001C1E35F2|nr:Gfo/Idh/MocA family oxidoreductase [Polymorphobacter megasporae]UAJ09365.1 Gfo/Idh/MocA family oxidoreductase [Polymorphobacter megasporae]